jgi:hypothetical protein
MTEAASEVAPAVEALGVTKGSLIAKHEAIAQACRVCMKMQLSLSVAAFAGK